MNLFKNYFVKWKKKKLFDKITDFLFLALILALLFPVTRTGLLVGVKRLTAFSPSAIQSRNRETVNPGEYSWEFETLDGKGVNLKDYYGKTIFINEWATWCPPCIAEMPSIEKLYEQLKNDPGVVFIIVTNEKKSVVQEFMDKNEYSFPVMLARTPTPEAFYSPSIPTTFLVSPEGEIVLKEVGAKKWHGEQTVSMIRSLEKNSE